MGPLHGIRIIEAAQLLNGPAASYMLGDLGAEVIKIETPRIGDMARGFISAWDVPMKGPEGINILFETANRNKRSIVLDLKSIFSARSRNVNAILHNFQHAVIEEC